MHGLEGAAVSTRVAARPGRFGSTGNGGAGSGSAGSGGDTVASSFHDWSAIVTTSGAPCLAGGAGCAAALSRKRWPCSTSVMTFGSARALPLAHSRDFETM